MKFAGDHAVYPVLSKFEKRISDIDEMACKSLTAVETKYPIITKDSNEVSRLTNLRKTATE